MYKVECRECRVGHPKNLGSSEVVVVALAPIPSSFLVNKLHKQIHLLPISLHNRAAFFVVRFVQFLKIDPRSQLLRQWVPLLLFVAYNV